MRPHSLSFVFEGNCKINSDLESKLNCTVLKGNLSRKFDQVSILLRNFRQIKCREFTGQPVCSSYSQFQGK